VTCRAPRKGRCRSNNCQQSQLAASGATGGRSTSTAFGQPLTRSVLLVFLLSVTLPAHASGDPSVIFAGLAQVLVVGAAIVYVLTAKVNWSQKGYALLPVAGSMGALIALDVMPDDTRNAPWLEPLPVFVAGLGGLFAWRLVRRS
jgi:hypothetical protein